ncbi:MAG: hypothetical protein H6705_18945 [Myxococcales bacterium]|nr:hypothetical protein [Myxococcales bacterium]
MRLKRRLTLRYGAALGVVAVLLVGTFAVGQGHIANIRRELDQMDAITRDRAQVYQILRLAERVGEGRWSAELADELRRAAATPASATRAALCDAEPLVSEADALAAAARALADRPDAAAGAALARTAAALVVRQSARLDGDHRQARNELELLNQISVVLLTAWLLLLLIEVVFVFRPGLRLIGRHIDDYARARRLEQQLRSARRMRVLGRMAGGMAHEFNNILMPIVGLSDLLRERVPVGSPDAALVDMLVEAGDRARRLVARARVLDRRLDFAEVDGAELLALARAQCEGQAGVERVEVAVEPAPLRFGADGAALAQAVAEVLRNALAAIAPGGRVTARVGRAGEGAGEVFIRVADDGAGMSAAVRESAFDPFFTTRSAGDGVGLGLSVAHGIVVAHGGRIELESIEGHGTAVTMYIPGDLMTTGDEA